MTAATAIDWNRWRVNYDHMSFAEHQAFNAKALRLHPEQRCWNGEACRRFLEERQPPRVAELGGWDGSLAAEMLPQFPDMEWNNYDITPGVPQVEGLDHEDYMRIVLDCWPWDTRPVFHHDTLIASHVFEHMRITEIERLIRAWDVDSIYIDCPISPGAQSWHGYEGSHILEVGSEELLHRIEQLGYRTSYRDDAGGLIAYMDRV